MQKAVTIRVKDIDLKLEEDAVIILENYLNEVRKHFAIYADGNEIIEDIEIRISEKAARLLKTKDDVLTKRQITKLVKEMGTVTEMDEVDHGGTFWEKLQFKLHNFKLLRDVSNQQIAGVCSGLGMYFDIDPAIFRLGFVLIALIGLIIPSVMAFIVQLYVLLWIIMSAAKTTVQRIEMKGEAVTLANIDKEAQRTVTTRLSPVAHLANRAQSIVSDIFQIVIRIGKVLTRISGVVLIIGSIASIFGLFLGLFFVLLHPDAQSISYPFPGIRQDQDFNLLVALAFTSGSLVSLLALQLGFSFAALRSKFRTLPTLAMIIAVIATSTLLIILGHVKQTNYIKSVANDSKNYELVTQTYDITTLSDLNLDGDYKVRLTNDNANTIKVTTNSYVAKQLHDSNFNGGFSLYRHPGNFYIPALDNTDILVEISKQKFEAINLSGMREITGKVAATNITLSAYNSIDLDVQATELDITAFSNSQVKLTGKVEDQTYQIYGPTKVDAAELTSKNSTVRMSDKGRLTLNVQKLLDIQNAYTGRVDYIGDPVVLKNQFSTMQIGFKMD